MLGEAGVYLTIIGCEIVSLGCIFFFLDEISFSALVSMESSAANEEPHKMSGINTLFTFTVAFALKHLLVVFS